MTTDSLQKPTVRVDAATKALIEEALQAAARGEILTEEEAEAELDEADRERQASQKMAVPG